MELQAQPRWTHLNIGSTRLHGHTIYQRKFLHSQTLFVFRWKTVWKMFSLCIFRWFQSSLTYHDDDTCGPHWWLRSYSSQASAGCKLKAECLFLICLELLFPLYCNFWHIVRSSDKVTWCLEDLYPEQKRKDWATGNDNDKTEYQ